MILTLLRRVALSYASEKSSNVSLSLGLKIARGSLHVRDDSDRRRARGEAE